MTRPDVEQHVLYLALDCQHTGTDFLKYLDTLSNQKSRSKIAKSVRESVKISWNQDKIQDFAEKLENFRNALSLATLLALRSGLGKQHTQVLDHLHLLRVAIEEQRLKKDVVEVDFVQTDHLQTVIQETMSRSDQKFDLLHDELSKCVETLEKKSQELQMTKKTTILRWLGFRQMLHRLEEVPLAHQRTFEWVFHRSFSERPWDSFVAYLEDDGYSAPYWINGKAGAGKSSLMKFIVNDQRTRLALRRWAGTDTLLTPSFFFWNLGTPLQKSYTGLLRSLLRMILEAYPELLPAVFPALWEDWSASDEDIEPTYIEVRTAFKLLLARSSDFLKLCIFIDGVDEYEGDHKEMSSFLRSLPSRQVKVVVSSRPITECVHTFKGCPTLRVPDLTTGDISIYITETLCQHETMVEFAKRHPEKATNLVREITSKASGVFLWVTITIRQLIDGLQSGDYVSDLQGKLRALPPDLKGLYGRMMDKMQVTHQAQAAEIFQLLRAWNEKVPGEPLSSLLMSFALPDPAEALQLPLGPLDGDAAFWRCQNTEARLRSRCCGLIEVYRKPFRKTFDFDEGGRRHNSGHDGSTQNNSNPEVASLINSTIEYLHRTVAEFLHSDEVWNTICSITSSQNDFDPAVRMAWACLALLKMQRTGFANPDEVWMMILSKLTTFIRSATRLSDHSLQQLLLSVDSIMYIRQQKKHKVDISASSKLHWSTDIVVHGRAAVCGIVASEHMQNLAEGANIVTFAARNGLVQYFRLLMRTDGATLPSSTTLVLHALESWLDRRLYPVLNERIEILEFLLQNVTSPMTSVYGRTYLDYAVTVAQELLTNRQPLNCGELLKVFVLARPSSSLVPLTLATEATFAVPRMLHIARSLASYKSIESFEFDYTLDNEVRQLGMKLERLILSVPLDALERDSSDVSMVEPSLGSHQQ